jgi:hypothetical protein
MPSFGWAFLSRLLLIWPGVEKSIRSNSAIKAWIRSSLETLGLYRDCPEPKPASQSIFGGQLLGDFNRIFAV